MDETFLFVRVWPRTAQKNANKDFCPDSVLYQREIFPRNWRNCKYSPLSTVELRLTEHWGFFFVLFLPIGKKKRGATGLNKKTSAPDLSLQADHSGKGNHLKFYSRENIRVSLLICVSVHFQFAGDGNPNKAFSSGWGGNWYATISANSIKDRVGVKIQTWSLDLCRAIWTM